LRSSAAVQGVGTKLSTNFGKISTSLKIIAGVAGMINQWRGSAPDLPPFFSMRRMALDTDTALEPP